MRFVLLIAVAVVACSPGDDRQIKADAHKAAEEVKADAKKASKEIDKGVRDAHDKIRKAVDDNK